MIKELLTYRDMQIYQSMVPIKEKYTSKEFKYQY